MASFPADTAFILVPGGYCPASLYHRVTERLTRLGFTVIESDHPTVDHRDKQHLTFMDDAAHIRSTASDLMDKGKNVIIAGNSYGGFVATEAVKELSKREREAAGKTGGILTNLVYFGSLLPPLALTCRQLIEGRVEVTTVGEDKVLDPPPAEAAGAMVMSDLSQEEQLYYGKQLQSEATAAFNTKLTHLGYLHVPTTYVVTERDRALDPKHQHENVDAVIASGKTNVRKKTIDADHCAMISHPDELVEILLDAAKQSTK